MPIQLTEALKMSGPTYSNWSYGLKGVFAGMAIAGEVCLVYRLFRRFTASYGSFHVD